MFINPNRIFDKIKLRVFPRLTVVDDMLLNMIYYGNTSRLLKHKNNRLEIEFKKYSDNILFKIETNKYYIMSLIFNLENNHISGTLRIFLSASKTIIDKIPINSMKTITFMKQIYITNPEDNICVTIEANQITGQYITLSLCYSIINIDYRKMPLREKQTITKQTLGELGRMKQFNNYKKYLR